MTDHPLVSALSEFLETHKMEAGLLLIPGDGELRLIGSGIGMAELIGISRSLDGYISAMLEPPPDSKPN
jgi:hypothetical protein